MQKFTYPQSDLDRGAALLYVLGSYWNKTFQAKDQIASYTEAIAAGANQLQIDLLETVAALSRFKIPVFHTENWYPITLHKNQLNLTKANLYHFDQPGLVFSPASGAAFDATQPTEFFMFNAPPKLASVAHIFDRVLFPTVDMVGDIDFKIDSANNAIIFTQNPFEIASIPHNPIYDKDGLLIDETITLWGFRANLDYQYVLQQFAYAVDVYLESSENAKKLVNAIFDALINGGASAAMLNAVLSAIFDVPVVRGEKETVELMSTDRRGVFIATDKEVYRFAAGSIPTVEVGQVVRKGDTLVDTFQVIDIHRGDIPTAFEALALDQNYTTACYYSDLIFENIEVPLRVDTARPDGYTYVDFPLAGFPADVRSFFDEIHHRGLRAIKPGPDPCKTPDLKKYGTLAHLLDRRQNPDSEPQALDLPATINPLQFLIKNVLRNHAFIVTVKLAGLGENKLPLYNIRHVRQLIPPHAGMFIVYNLNGLRDGINGDKMLLEDMSVFKGAAPLADSVSGNRVVDKGVIVRTVSGTCE